MIIPTLGTGQLYQVHKNKQRWLTDGERRKAFLLTATIFAVITVGVLAYILQ